MSNEITVKQFFEKDAVQLKMKELLGSKSKQFITNVLQVVNNNALLSKADPTSVFNSAMMGAMLDLPMNPSLGLAYIVPYGGKAQFQIGYKGLKQLAIRSGQFKSIETKEVYEGQIVEDNSFTGFRFDWGAKKSEKIIGYANRFELLNGFEKTLYMTTEQIQAHGKKYSKTYSMPYGNWNKEFNAMALKTVAKLNLNSGEAPLSIEMQQAIKFDQSSIKNYETEEIEYVDNSDFKLLIDLSDSDVLEVVQEIKNGNTTLDKIKDEFNLSVEQLKNIEDATKN